VVAPDYSSLPRLTISLQVGDSPDPQCTELVDMLFPIYTKNMDAVLPGYGRLGLGTSVNVLPATYDEWFEAVGYGTRRKVRRATKGGYTFRLIDRDQHLAELHAINTSMETRSTASRSSRSDRCRSRPARGTGSTPTASSTKRTRWSRTPGST
jgi:hypothetical protein